MTDMDPPASRVTRSLRGGMRCLSCGAKTRVTDTNPTDQRSKILRKRVCMENSAHVIDTVEQRIGIDIDRDVVVRRSGSKEVGSAFDRERNVEDLRRATLKRLTRNQHVQVVDEAISHLSSDLDQTARLLSETERRAHAPRLYSIDDTEIRDAIELVLRRNGYRMSHVLYALSIRGRHDREGRTGWNSARDVLAWIYNSTNYSDLTEPIPDSAVDRPYDLWLPERAAPVPNHVVKRARNGETGGPDKRQFNKRGFRGSVEEAMFGRPNAAKNARYVTEWVLWGLAGQRIVHTAQLAVGVLDCLRRVDDIAYLRWAATAKNFESVADFRDEAVALIAAPSPRLIFDLAGMTRPIPTDPRVRPAGRGESVA